jgi:hypothetical protein
MPDKKGNWTYKTHSNAEELDGEEGSFQCIAPSKDNHGPVRVRDTYHFEYADGTPYYPFGTTCYAWNHQPKNLVEQTLSTLEKNSFNKVRMCVFPKRFEPYITNEPPYYPYEGNPPDQWNFSRFNPEFFQNLEKRILDLQQRGIQADLIIFHPYDYGHWGFSTMTPDQDVFYLKYLVSRLSAFRNVWWAMANEWDLMDHLEVSDWDRFFKVLVEKDPYRHLKSIHNAGKLYDHNKPWITHVSLQKHDPDKISQWREQYRKPIIIDEASYEGDIGYNYGDLTGEIMTMRFWKGLLNGGYLTHGEMYLHPENILWWSKGGTLHGTSPERINFFKKILEETTEEGVEPIETRPSWNQKWCGGNPPESYLFYYGPYQPAFRPFDMPDKYRYKAEIIDTWEMTIKEVEGTFQEEFRISLPAKPYMAIRLTRVD